MGRGVEAAGPPTAYIWRMSGRFNVCPTLLSKIRPELKAIV
jgi:hypothetical protein